jgi:hypothetical protein
MTDPFARLVMELRRSPDNAYNLGRYEAELIPRCRPAPLLRSPMRRSCPRPPALQGEL